MSPIYTVILNRSGGLLWERWDDPVFELRCL
jgi:hypothetical protein